jgi:hypothetical protein
MSMTERRHGNAGGEIEVTLAVFGEEIRALATLEDEITARVGRKEWRYRHGELRPKIKLPPTAAAMNSRALGLVTGPVNQANAPSFQPLVHPFIHSAICVPTRDMADSLCPVEKRRAKHGGRLLRLAGYSRVIIAQPQYIVVQRCA